MYTKKQKTLAFLTCATFILVALFSILFIVEEADHDCTGENCPVCACIHQAEQTLKQLGTGVAEAAAPAPIMAQFVLTLACVFLIVPFTTLVKQKVRLND
ncbi:hypothetical protein [Enterocloster clostridioformis]|uniref:Uncharacterized protein n=1 Tax=[Clostridium] clostridioforme 90A8 TaxID=999408 RepID=A0A0E2H274_9FIRM|nr:hypothetical protein [Enterocloster clostridioformis]ENZ05313.1 hypothetical protein HMPREF1090_05688 [[Clostridium] clostridioforme 90A8]MBS6166121.1 hypothetical protein [Bacillota bacterium]